MIKFTQLDTFTKCLTILANADFKMAESNDIYRTGIIGQFNLTFELAWKALQEIMRMHSVKGADTGSPREILQLGYKIGFINDPEVWLLMLKKRNTSDHIYNEVEVDEIYYKRSDSSVTIELDGFGLLDCGNMTGNGYSHPKGRFNKNHASWP